MLLRVLENRLVKGMTRLALVISVLLAAHTVASSASSACRINYSTLAVSFQQEDGWAAIKTDEGILFAWNLPELHFTLEIRGKDIKPLNVPDHIFFTVDGMALQIQVASIREFAPHAKDEKLDDKTVLAAHRDWESKFIEGLLHSKLKVQVSSVTLGSGSDASLWRFDMPEGIDSEVKTQLYLTVVRNDFVVMLNGEATTTISQEAARKFLLDTMATMKISPTPIDVKKLAESIRGGTRP